MKSVSFVQPYVLLDNILSLYDDRIFFEFEYVANNCIYISDTDVTAS